MGESVMEEGGRLALLQNVPVFGAIRSEIIAQLVDSSPSVTIDAGEYLFREGDASTSMYVIESGQVAVIKKWNEKEYLLKHLHEGDCIGEMALFDFFPRSASIVAVGETRLIEITSANLMEIYGRDLEQFTLLQMNMGREVTRRLRDADDQLFKDRVEAAVYDGKVSDPLA